MSNLGLHLLHHVAVHFGKHWSSQKVKGQRKCHKCGGNTAIRPSVKCPGCKTEFCYICARPMLKEFEDNDFGFTCGICGKRSMARPFDDPVET